MVKHLRNDFKKVSDHIKNALGEFKSDRVIALRDLLKADFDNNIASKASISDFLVVQRLTNYT